MVAFRYASAAALIAVGALLVAGRVFDTALAFAMLVLGVTILVHIVFETLWNRWNVPVAQQPSNSAAGQQPGNTPAAQQPVNPGPSPETIAALRGFPTVFVTTSGVVLALLAAFGTSKSPGPSIRVASLALAASILLSIILGGALVGSLPVTRRTGLLMSLVFNLTWWTLAFGLLCIAFAILFIS
jgi:hypothetical protein